LGALCQQIETAGAANDAAHCAALAATLATDFNQARARISAHLEDRSAPSAPTHAQ
jgi:hypothetical protein